MALGGMPVGLGWEGGTVGVAVGMGGVYLGVAPVRWEGRCWVPRWAGLLRLVRWASRPCDGRGAVVTAVGYEGASHSWALGSLQLAR